MSKRHPLIGILDDEDGFRRALTRLLSSHGFQVVGFASGAELLAETRRRRFDCLLLDLYMPGMTGLDVLAELRWNPDPTPAIVITGHDDPDLVKRAIALKAFE